MTRELDVAIGKYRVFFYRSYHFWHHSVKIIGVSHDPEHIIYKFILTIKFFDCYPDHSGRILTVIVYINTPVPTTFHP